MKSKSSLSKLCKKAKSTKYRNFIEIAIYSVILFFIILMGILCFLTAYMNEGFKSASLFFCVFLIIISLCIYFGRKNLKNTVAANKKKAERLEALSYPEITALEEEISNSEFQYKTFYKLKDYLFVPSAKLLISYSEISDWKNVLHSTNGINDGMKIKITDNCNIRYEFNVKKWKDYYNYLNSNGF